jgi:hypothetical protein
MGREPTRRARQRERGIGADGRQSPARLRRARGHNCNVADLAPGRDLGLPVPMHRRSRHLQEHMGTLASTLIINPLRRLRNSLLIADPDGGRAVPVHGHSWHLKQQEHM